jgi:hypothetical protein
MPIFHECEQRYQSRDVHGRTRYRQSCRLLDLARIDAARIVAANIHQMESIAAALIEHKTLDGAEIDQILAGMTPAQRAEKLRRKKWTDTIAGAEAFRLAHGGLRVMI